MAWGYSGKILVVNLSTEKIEIENPDYKFYREYMGGSAIGAYYCLKNIPRNADPLGPDNVLVFSASVLTGAPLPFLSRINVNAKSPLTGALGDSQGGGWFGPELKFAGFDAIVIKGKAKKPSYLWINDGKVEIRNAEHVWGMTTGEAEQIIKNELDDKGIRIASIGIAGENMVRYACIVNERKHANGRTGMGAVMGSKNLKAIAVKGNKKNLEYENYDELIKKAKKEVRELKENPGVQAMNELGTNEIFASQHEIGGLPTRNFKEAIFPGYENLTAEKMNEQILVKREGCFACPVNCKRAVESKEHDIDSKYGGPEYETVASLGSYIGVNNLYVVAKANELCNKYSLDTISTGASIAFAMDCFENGLLTLEDTDGLKLEFGNEEAVVPLINKIAKREGIGNLLADGPKLASIKLGKDAKKYSIEVKGNPLPAHMPRQKQSMAIIYAVNPSGADHCSAGPDMLYDPNLPEEVKEMYRQFGLNDFTPVEDLNFSKVRMIYYTQMYMSMMDSIMMCMFTPYMLTFDKIIELIKDVTGWKVSSWELMKLGERKMNMFKEFSYRQGLTIKDDYLPDRLFEPIPEGPTKGLFIDKDILSKCIEDYYDIAGWDKIESQPTEGKIKELNLQWILDER